jgi:hypothetical protein
MSLRSFANAGLHISVMSRVALGSSVSIRSIARFTGKSSVLDYFSVGSALSLRSSVCTGSSFSIHGDSRFGGSLSLL